MRLAVLVYSLDQIGGIAKHSLTLCREFVDMGHDVTVWAVEYDQERCYPELTADFEVNALRTSHQPVAKVDRLPTGTRMAAYLWDTWRLYREQRELAALIPDEYDIINPHGNTIMWSAVDHKRRYGTPIVWMCNDFWPLGDVRTSPNRSMLTRARALAKGAISYPVTRYDRAAVRAVDKTIVLSEGVQAQMADYYDVDDPIIIRTGVDKLPPARSNGHSIKAQYGFSEDTFLLLTVCLLMPRRRLEDVIEAVRLLRDEGIDVGYMVVGRTSFYPDYTQFLKDEVAAHRLEDRIKFVGEIPDDTLPEYVHAGDAFVWAADQTQSWGMAALEAMAAGKPAIVSKENGLSEALEDGVTALLSEPRSPHAIADAAKSLITDRARASAVAQRGQALVHEKYSWRANAQAMVDVFHAALDK